MKKINQSIKGKNDRKNDRSPQRSHRTRGHCRGRMRRVAVLAVLLLCIGLGACDYYAVGFVACRNWQLLRWKKTKSPEKKGKKRNDERKMKEKSKSPYGTAWMKE